MKQPVYYLFLFTLITLNACTTAPQVTETIATNAPISTEEAVTSNQLTGKLVYSTEGDVYVMNADGSDVKRLTTDPAADFDPVWSPDGTQIAFRSHRDGNGINEEVYIMNADGSDQRNLTNASSTEYSPAWSPNGNWIAFMSDRDGGNPNIWVIRPDGSNLRQLTDLPGISEYPSWSPDSKQIVFNCTFGKMLSNGSADFEICIVNADGTGVTQLTDSPGQNELPAWSPNGKQIAFQSNRQGWPTLPGYEPFGYDPREFGEFEIYIMNVDGTDQKNITNNPREDDEHPAWSRDGRLIFTRYGCFWIMNADGLDVNLISEDSCAGIDSGNFPDWYQPIK